MEQEQKTIVNEKQPANVDKRKQRKILSPKKTATITKRTLTFDHNETGVSL